jgi:hypothetical protein
MKNKINLKIEIPDNNNILLYWNIFKKNKLNEFKKKNIEFNYNLFIKEILNEWNIYKKNSFILNN